MLGGETIPWEEAFQAITFVRVCLWSTVIGLVLHAAALIFQR